MLRQKGGCFHFSSELICLFFERFPEMSPTLVRQPHRLMLHAQMHMWGKMMPTRGETKFSARISHDALELLANVDDHPFIMVPILMLVWIGEGVPKSSSQMMSCRMIEVTLLFYLNLF